MDQPINSKKSRFLVNFIAYSFIPFGCSLFFSYPYWFSVNHFLFTSLPNIWSSFFNPKCSFLLGNTIILFLIGESKLLGSQSPAAELYYQHVEETREMGLERNILTKENLNKMEESQEVEVELEDGGDDDKEKKKGDEEEELGLPAEELNRRVEEFIARFNEQRWLEAKLLVFDDTDQ